MSDEQIKALFCTVINTLVILGEHSGANDLLQKDLTEAAERAGITMQDLTESLENG